MRKGKSQAKCSLSLRTTAHALEKESECKGTPIIVVDPIHIPQRSQNTPTNGRGIIPDKSTTDNDQEEMLNEQSHTHMSSRKG